ncbi:NVEALA domain-containing protein [Parabacteroides goldsteinii]|uniref:NVEALA domain-containing protein n=1 Tax=Parabacteroides goldsteinii TaxID=328812 RepID=UPI0039964C2F
MKKILGIITIISAVTVTSWNFYQSHNKVDFSDLTLINANALANNEDDGLSRPCPYEGGTCYVSVGSDVWIKNGYQKTK